MRPSRLVLLAGAFAAPAAWTACIVPLDDEFTGGEPSADAAAAEDDAPVASGCAPFAGVQGVSAVSGDLHSVALPEGGDLWIADQADQPDGGVTLAATFALGAGAGPDCTGSATLGATAFDPSPVDPAGLLVSLDVVSLPSGVFAYFTLFAADPTMAFGLRLLGYGVAPRSGTTGRFTPGPELLWSADRPDYGASAMLAGGWLYVHGCKSNAPLTDDCYVARVDPGAALSASSYSYWAGSTWSPDADDAVPVTPGGGSVSVRADPTGVPRFLMTYVAPFGTSLVARSAIAPEGPWSGPVELAGCALDPSIPGAFCGGGEQHPELAPGADRLVISYDDRTFATDAGPDPRGFWPHLVDLPIPPTLP